MNEPSLLVCHLADDQLTCIGRHPLESCLCNRSYEASLQGLMSHDKKVLGWKASYMAILTGTDNACNFDHFYIGISGCLRIMVRGEEG